MELGRDSDTGGQVKAMLFSICSLIVILVFHVGDG